MDLDKAKAHHFEGWDQREVLAKWLLVEPIDDDLSKVRAFSQEL